MPRFNMEPDIKIGLSLFGDDRQSHQTAGDFLYFTARQKGEFDKREQIKARREVDTMWWKGIMATNKKEDSR